MLQTTLLLPLVTPISLSTSIYAWGGVSLKLGKLLHFTYRSIVILHMPWHVKTIQRAYQKNLPSYLVLYLSS